MKIRIVTNGEIFRVERKWFLRGWITDHTDEVVVKVGNFQHGFTNYDSAERWIHKKYGTNTKIERTWEIRGYNA